MNKIVWLVVCLAILGTGIYYLYTKKEAAERYNFSTWKEFVPKSKLFKVLLPSTPQYAKDFIAIPNSEKKRRYDMYASDKVDGTLFLISVITYPSEVDTSSSNDILRQNIDDLIHNKADNQLTKILNNVLDGLNNIDFSIENQAFHVEGKAIQDDKTVYMLTYITRKENFDPKEYQYFFDSFQLLNKGNKVN